jgi:glycosyltransferase involved in cell wall biosynthesis
MCLHGIGPGLISGLARLLGMRVVVTYHSRNYDHAKWSRIGRLALRLGERTTFRFADKVIVVAAWLEQELALSYAMHRGKLVHIPNGVSELGAEPCYPPSGELEAGFVLAVGRLVPEKGFDYLIRAAQAANVRLVIAGAADHDSAHARDLLASAGDRITFLGRQPRERLRWLYENARLFVLPSFHEGMPLAALEAISCGTPVLLSDIPANRDLALPPDRYFSTGREDILAERLTEAHPSSFRFAQTLRKSFDWDEIAAQTVETLEQVARGD